MNELTPPNVGITDIGLPDISGLDEATFFELGHRLVQAEHGLQWAIGDWYNAIPWGNKEKACVEVGLNYRTAKECGIVSSKFKMTTRVVILSFKHHRQLVHADIGKGQRTELLRLAVAGSPAKNGASKIWSSARLKEERDKLLGLSPPAPVDGFAEKVHTLTEAVVSVLPKSAGRRSVNKTKSGIQKLAADMQHDFHKAVEKQVDLDLKVQRENLRTAKADAQEEFDRTIKMQAGVKAFMTREEFILVRSCLHPDKNSHPRAGEAFTIFNRLADVKAWDK